MIKYDTYYDSIKKKSRFLRVKSNKRIMIIRLSVKFQCSHVALYNIDDIGNQYQDKKIV